MQTIRYPYYQAEPSSRKWWYACCIALVLPLSLFSMICFIVSSDFLGMGARSPQAMLEGTALKPHVYRQFIPAITRGILDITSDTARQNTTRALHDTLWNIKLFDEAVKLRHRSGTPPELFDEHLYSFAIIVTLDYLFLLGYAYMLWRLAKELFPDQFSMEIMAPIFGILALPPFCGKYGYIYDFPALFFAGWLTLLLVRQRWLWYFIGFAIATYNKETAIYLFGVYLLCFYDEMPRKQWLVYGVIQLVIFAVIKVLLAMVYAQGDNTILEYRGIYGHLRANLDGYSVYTLLGLIGGLALFTYRWEDKPVILRCWLVLLPLMVVAFLLFGNRNEYRVFYDIFPALTLLGCHTLVTALQWQQPAGRSIPRPR